MSVTVRARGTRCTVVAVPREPVVVPLLWASPDRAPVQRTAERRPRPVGACRRTSCKLEGEEQFLNVGSLAAYHGDREQSIARHAGRDDDELPLPSVTSVIISFLK